MRWFESSHPRIASLLLVINCRDAVHLPALGGDAPADAFRNSGSARKRDRVYGRTVDDENLVASDNGRTGRERLFEFANLQQVAVARVQRVEHAGGITDIQAAVHNDRAHLRRTRRVETPAYLSGVRIEREKLVVHFRRLIVRSVGIGAGDSLFV